MKTLIKSINCCQTLLLDCLLTYVVKFVCQASLPSFLTWVNLAMFGSMPNGNCLYSSASLSSVIVWRDNPLVHELRVMAAVELRVNATYYTQHPAFKSVYGKGLAVTDVKLFSFP